MSPVLKALSSFNLFALCGAGLAIPIIPTMPGIAQLGVAEYHRKIGFYPVDRVPLSPFRYRWLDPVLGVSSNRQRTWEWHKDLMLLQGAPEPVFEVLFQLQTLRPFESVAPYNYRIFMHVRPNAVLFDFNTDGQLSEYCAPPHIVLNPHGRIDRLILQRFEIDDLLRYAAYGIRVPSEWLWFPSPELSTMTRNRPYEIAMRCLSSPGEFFLVIGYSFGRQPNGSIDDAKSFEFFCELLKRFRRRIVVLDPNPDHLAGLLEDELHQRIYVCQLFWNYLAKSACVAINEMPEAPNLYEVRRRVARLYDERTR